MRVLFLQSFLKRGEERSSDRDAETPAASERAGGPVRVRNETLGHDTTRPPASAATRPATGRLGFPALPHPPPQPRAAPRRFHLFPKVRQHGKGRRVICDAAGEESAVKRRFQKESTATCRDGFPNPVPRCCKRPAAGGASVENHLGSFQTKRSRFVF